MNFEIEVAGEANPLSQETLYKTLTSASSGNLNQIKAGTQQLQNWEKHPGFHSSLQSIFLDPSLPFEVRYLSIIHLKNGIDKYWRKAALSAIQKSEKEQIRSRAIESGTKEPDFHLASQNALMISKIIRYEFPLDWPDAISVVSNNLRLTSQPNSPKLQLTRALLILLEVIKELSTARLQRTRAGLQSSSLEVLQVLGNVYVDKMQTWMTFLNEGGDDEGGAIISIEQSLLAVRILRRLLVAGWDFPNRSGEVQEAWSLINSHLKRLLSLLADQTAVSETVKRLIEKHLRQMGKLHVNLAKDHPAGFALLKDSTYLLSFYWNIVTRFDETLALPISNLPEAEKLQDENYESLPVMEFLSLKGLLLLRACVKMIFSPAQTFRFQQQEDKEEKAYSRQLIKDNVLTSGFARTVMETLVTRFFIIRQRDLREWEDEPEMWEMKEEGGDDLAEYSLRSCAEKLFLDLILNYKSEIVQPLLSAFTQATNAPVTEVFLKDSVYSAIGIGAPMLVDQIEFDAFLRNTLLKEMQVNEPGYNILRRRIAIVLGQWLLVKDGLDRPLVYDIFQHLLDRDHKLNDMVVRITAGRQLKNIILPFEFDPKTFSPYAPTILSALLALIGEVDTAETLLALLSTLSVLVENMKESIIPFAEQIMSFLPTLWDHSLDQFLVKQTILGILTSLVTSTKITSQQYHSRIIPLIDNSVDVQSGTYIQLGEDAMDLWEAILQQTPASNVPDLLRLVPRLFPLLETGSSNLVKALKMMETYIYLAPNEMLFFSANTMLSPLAGLLGGSKREVAGSILDIADLLMQTATAIDGPPGLWKFANNFLQTRFLQVVVEGLRGNHQARQTTGPNRVQTWLDVLVETRYLSTLARLTILTPDLLIDAVSNIYSNEPIEHAMTWILDEWFSHLDNMSHPDGKKLNCLALTALLRTGQAYILTRLQELMTMWTEVALDLYEDEGEDKPNDSLVYLDIDALKGEQETLQQGLTRKMVFNDPVHRIDVKTHIRETLQYVVEKSGGNEEFRNRWLVNVDADVLQAFGKLGIY
ncbi:MAG: hypothetical protein Q9174_004434 [Haloplaca sp. 1 TL-2023]